jgi:hypothetical protein
MTVSSKAMWHITFTNAGALALGAAAVLPVVIHLLSRQRPKLIRFTGVRFIQLSQRRSFRRTQFKHLLLLLLRMGLIALFALLIARPVLTHGAAAGAAPGAEGTPAAAIILDDSLSMNYRVGDATWFDEARSRALELAARLPERCAAAVLTTSHPSGRLQHRADALTGRVSGLLAGTRSNSCWQALETAAGMLRAEAASRRDVFLFTDMTPSAWAGYEQRTVDLGKEVNLYVVDCATGEAANGAVSELRQEGEPAILGAKLSLEARVLASGAPLSRAMQFEFDGTAVEQRPVSLQAGDQATIRFSTILTSTGHHWGRVAFMSPDGLPQDDARTFTVEVAPEVSVLCIEDNVSSGVESPSYFFRLALNPWDEPGRGMFGVQRASPGQLEQMQLSPFDVIALVGAGRMNDAAWQRLDAYVSGGGGLVVFAGPETGESYGTGSARAVLPVEVGPVVAAPPEAQLGLRVVKSSHPFVSALMASGATLAQVHYRQCRRLSPGRDALELLSFGPDLPALVLSEARGKVAVFAGTADDRWGDFAKTQPFIPFCHELLLLLASRAGAGIQSANAGAQLPITFEASRWATTVYVTPPGAREAERLLPGTTPGKLTYWKTDAPGYYRVDFERRDTKWRSGFAVNTAAIESRLEKVPFEKVKKSIRAGKVELMTEATLSTDNVAAGGSTRELTPYLALLALSLLLAESFLANRFYGSASAPSEPPN